MPLLPARSTVLRALLPLALVVGAFVATNANAAGPLRGPDVASWQHPGGAAIDWRAVKAGGSSFAFIKATEATSYTNPYFAGDWAGAASVGLVRGAYHYASPGSGSAAAQARYFIRATGSTRELGTLAPVLDLEESGGLSPRDLSAWTHEFLSTVEQLTGRVPILYTYPNFWRNAMADDTTFGAYPLWLASYRSSPPAPLPGWSQWTFWQHTSSASVSGIRGPADENYLCCGGGTLAALADGRSGPITALWRRLGGASGGLGLPTGPEAQVPGGWVQQFQRGAIAYSRAYGAHAIVGGVWSRWTSMGGAAGPLGLPIDDLTRVAPAVQQQIFTGGRVTASNSAGTHSLRGPYLSRWLAEGGVRSPLGIPNAEPIGRPGGESQQFESAGVYIGTTARSRGLHVVPGTIRDRYEALGGPQSALGMPTSDAQPLLLGQRVDFEVGSLIDLVLPVANKRAVLP